MKKINVISFFLLGVQSVCADVLVFEQKSHRQIEVEFRDLQANFGTSIPPLGMRAYVVYANPENGCTDLEPPPHLANFTKHWAVLIRRYDCSFEVKVRNAQKANYDIAIIHNVNSSELEKMTAENPEDIIIPSIFVGSNTGKIIKERYLYNKGYYVIIDDDDSPFDIGAHLLIPFAIVVAICFMTMVGFMVVKCIKDHRRARRHRLPGSSLNKIPTTKFRKNDPYETCAICLDDFIEGEKLRILPCSHAYHCKCIDPWLTHNKRVCPMCKRRVFTEDENIPSDSDSGSEDDNTPLLRSTNNTTTRGGTFDNESHSELLNQFLRSYMRRRLDNSGTSVSTFRRMFREHTAASPESTSNASQSPNSVEASSSNYESIYNTDTIIVQPGGESSIQTNTHEVDNTSVSSDITLA